MTSPPHIALIVAAAENGVIGRGGGLPWRIPSDLKTFRRLTMGKPVVMGRKTFVSLGKPLAGRDNIIVTRDRAFRAEGAHVVPSLMAALELARELASQRGVDEVMVIGGGQIYAEALPRADRVYLSRVHASPDGDTTFPQLAAETWQLAETTLISAQPGDDHPVTLLIYQRRQAVSASAPS